MAEEIASTQPLYSASRRPELVDVPDRSFLAIDGTGDPERSLDFQMAVDALAGVAHALKLGLRALGFEPSTPPLEALWWTDEEHVIDLARKTSAWRWRLMIGIPDEITKADVDDARAAARAEQRNSAIDRIKMVRYAEGLCVQILHVGPYSTENKTIERLHAYANEKARQIRGRHHEIYLGDPRTTKPEDLRTILRQPIA